MIEITGGWWRWKLAEKGYTRSAKKCKEKFENVHKYYKRTKESRAGRSDGKTYRFFTQLEALHGTGGGNPSPPASLIVPTSGAAGPSAVRVQPPPAMAAGMPFGNQSFSTYNTEDYSDDEGTQDLGGGADERGKRKRASSDQGGAAAAVAGGGSRSGGKMMRFFVGLMKRVMERQEAMQQRFLEAIEKREQDRMIREEAWRRQEMTRLAREQEILAQERAMAASRDAAVLSFTQKITRQTIPLLSITAPTINAMPPPPQPHPKLPPPQQPSSHPTPIASASLPPPPASHPPPAQQPPPQRQTMPATPQAPQQQSTDIIMTPASEKTAPHAADTPGHNGSGGGGGATSSRWPKVEVHALIQLRSNLDTRYQEAGPKGPLWEEISAGMRRLGYSRNAKRCKEKWENINKYFKKVKESNKKRPEDAKTCPYFHQLDALYRNKATLSSSAAAAHAIGGGSTTPLATQPHREMVTVTAAAPISQTPPPSAPAPPTMPPSQSSSQQHATKNGGGSNAAAGNGGGTSSEHSGSGGMQAQASNGGVAVGRYFGEAGGGGGTASAAKKPEDIMEEMMEQRQPQAVVSFYNRIDGGADSDNMDEDEDDYDDDEDDEDDDVDSNKMQYEIQFQQQRQHHHHQPPQRQQQQQSVVRPSLLHWTVRDAGLQVASESSSSRKVQIFHMVGSP
ncbi:unnamed protein product [Urochloa humidicola]